MKDFRCTCKKIVFQIDGDDIIIKCRHCKRYIHIHTKGLTTVEYRVQDEAKQLNIG